MKILRQKFFNEENSLSKAGKATALLGGGGLAASTAVAASQAIARSKNITKYNENEVVKDAKMKIEKAAKDREEISKFVEKAKKKIDKRKGMWSSAERELFDWQYDKFRNSFQKAYDKIVKDNHARIKEARAEIEKNEKALRKALGGMGISAAVAATGAGMYLKGRKKNKED